ncbi:MAG: hypothetical protein FWG90_01910 [Oscillospiraceae bacterium]|nr:hypothetical protein [Oscillospiraceae bacterium]
MAKRKKISRIVYTGDRHRTEKNIIKLEQQIELAETEIKKIDIQKRNVYKNILKHQGYYFPCVPVDNGQEIEKNIARLKSFIQNAEYEISYIESEISASKKIIMRLTLAK